MTGNDFLISRNRGNDYYAVWRFDPRAPEVFTRTQPERETKFDRRHHLAQAGAYLLEWGPLTLEEYAPSFPYRLFEFEPAAADPLSAERSVQKGLWSKQKFWGYRADFGNPAGRERQYATERELQLLPLGGFVLHLILTAGRGTFHLWNFDPAPTAPGTADPLPVAYSPMGAFETIQHGTELLALGDYVLTRDVASSDFALWSFDPQDKMPLSRPVLTRGNWASKRIDATHELVVVGKYILDFEPKTLAYRVWQFDPTAPDPLGERPLCEGTLPAAPPGDPARFDEGTRFVGVQTRLPLRAEQTSEPGTLDFMRSKIKHVVYYMLENRSFDHVCGWLYEHGDQGVHYLRAPGDSRPYDGASTEYFNLDEPGGKEVHLKKAHGGKLGTDYTLDGFEDDPYHDVSDMMRHLFFQDPEGYVRRRTPNMGGFVWNNGTPDVMQTYTPEQLPVLNGLARQFAISDAWFSSSPGATDVNRAFALTGSALNMLENWQNGAEYQYWPERPHRASIWKTLWTNGVTDWKIYNAVEWMTFVFTYHLFLDGQIPSVDANPASHVAGIDRFFDDARNGTLPAFSFLEPIWISLTGTSSYHPGGDLIPGERQLNRIYEALRGGKGWDETLLVISFDEPGGIFDHVPPPYAAKAWPNDVRDGFRYDLMGPRVPAILVSPWIKPQTVFRSTTSVAYDSTSVLATLLEWQGIPRERWCMGARVQHAPTFEGVLCESSPRKDHPTFTPPYDQAYPSQAREPGNAPVHALHRLMAPRLLVALAGGKLSPAELEQASAEVLNGARDLRTLHQRITQISKRWR